MIQYSIDIVCQNYKIFVCRACTETSFSNNILKLVSVHAQLVHTKFFPESSMDFIYLVQCHMKTRKIILDVSLISDIII